jgi:WD40 repeat protein
LLHYFLLAIVALGPPVDAYGDPLPAGAVARLGTSRWRCQASSAVVSPDGKYLAVHGSQLHSIQLLEAGTGRLLGRIEHDYLERRAWPSRLLAFTPDGSRLLAGMGHDLAMYSIPDLKELQRVDFHAAVAEIAKADPGAHRIATDGKIAIISGFSGWCVSVDLATNTPSIGVAIPAREIDISNDAQYVAGALGAGVGVYKTKTGQVLWNREVEDTVLGLAIGSQYVAAVTAGEWWLFDRADGKLRQRRPLPPQGIPWRLQVRGSNRYETELEPYGESYRKPVAFDSESRTLLINLIDNRILPYDTATGEPLPPLPGAYAQTLPVPTPDGSTAIVLEYEHCRPWNYRTGQVLRRYDDVPGWGTLSNSPDGRYTAVAYRGFASLYLWDWHSMTGRNVLRTSEWNENWDGTAPRWISNTELESTRSGGYGPMRFQVGTNRIHVRPFRHIIDNSGMHSYVAGSEGKEMLFESKYTDQGHVSQICNSEGTVIWEKKNEVSLLISPDRRRLVVRDLKNVELIDAGTGQTIRPLRGLQMDAADQAFAESNHKTLNCRGAFTYNPYSITSWARRGDLMVASGKQGLRFFAATNGIYRGEWKHSADSTGSFRKYFRLHGSLSDDGAYCLTPAADGIRLVETATFKNVITLPENAIGHELGPPIFHPNQQACLIGNRSEGIIAYSLRPPGPPPANPIASLKGADARTAYIAVWHIADHFDQFDATLRKEFPPVRQPPPNLENLLRDLDAPAFARRDAAKRELQAILMTYSGLYEQISAARNATDSAEVRAKLDELLKNHPLSVPTERALAAVVRSKHPAAKQLLKDWSAGHPAAALTQGALRAIAP